MCPAYVGTVGPYLTSTTHLPKYLSFLLWETSLLVFVVKNCFFLFVLVLELRSHYIAQGGLKLKILLLPRPPEWLADRHG